MRLTTSISLRIAFIVFLFYQSNAALCAGAKVSDKAWKEYISDSEKYLKDKDFVAADGVLVWAVEEAEHFKSSDPRLGETLSRLAETRLQMRKYADAENYYRRALATNESLYGTNNLKIAWDSINLSRACMSNKKYEETEQLLNRAESLVKSLLGPEVATVGVCMRKKALLYFVQNRLEESETAFKTAVGLLEKNADADKAVGNLHFSAYFYKQPAEVLGCLKDMAWLYMSQKRFPEAETVLKRAVKTGEGYLSESDEQFAELLNELAVVEYELKEFSEAEVSVRRSLKILTKSSSLNRPILVDTRRFLDRCLKAQGKALEHDK